MKNIILSLILFSFYSLSGQTSKVINDSFTAQFLHDKIDDLNKKIYTQVSEQKVIAYTNDSLNTPIPLTRLKSSADYPIQLNGLVGFSFVFKKEITDLSYKYKLSTLGPCYSPEIEGIMLDPQHAFFIGLGDLSNIFTKEEKLLIESLAMKRASVGDFTPQYNYNNMDKSLNTLDALVDAATYQPNASFLLLKEDIPIYAKSLQSIVTNCLYLMEKDKVPMYKDKSLSIEYSKLSEEVVKTNTIAVLDSNNQSKEKTIIIPFNYSYLPFVVHKINKDYLIEYKVTNKDLSKGKIFFKYSSIKPYLLGFDQILLETIFEEAIGLK